MAHYIIDLFSGANMIKIKTLSLSVNFCLFCFSLLLMFSACGSAPSPSTNSSGSNNSGNNNSGASVAEAQALAQAALNRMDGVEPAAPAAGQAAPAPTQQNAPPAQQGTVSVSVSTGAKPAWVDSVDSSYSRARYVAAVGYASDRASAEKNALANLAAFFGQSIQADQTSIHTYQEAVKNGWTAGWTDNLSVQNTIKTSASMDTLVGAEIKEVWLDSRNNTYYAAAVMEKAKTVQLYNEMILANQNLIDNLITMTVAEKNTIEGFSRYQFAATVADINTSYANLLRLLDSTPPAGLKTGNDYRLEATYIAREIPVRVVMLSGSQFDSGGRIADSFAKALSDYGFRTAANASPYTLELNLTLTEEPSSQNVYARYIISANFIDTKTKQGIIPVYNINSREGHADLPRAQNRAIAAAEKRIDDEYAQMLRENFSALLSNYKKR